MAGIGEVRWLLLLHVLVGGWWNGFLALKHPISITPHLLDTNRWNGKSDSFMGFPNPESDI